MESSEFKFLFLLPEMHRNIFLNTVHEQAIESDKYINILETCLKNHWFDSLYPKYWVRFSLLFTKPMFQK